MQTTQAALDSRRYRFYGATNEHFKPTARKTQQPRISQTPKTFPAFPITRCFHFQHLSLEGKLPEICGLLIKAKKRLFLCFHFPLLSTVSVIRSTETNFLPTNDPFGSIRYF